MKFFHQSQIILDKPFNKGIISTIVPTRSEPTHKKPLTFCVVNEKVGLPEDAMEKPL